MRNGRAAGRATSCSPADGSAVALLVAAWALVAAGCTSAEPEPAHPQVSIRAFRYVPARVTVASGDTVVWINEDAVPHTATADGRSWDTGGIASNQSRRVVVSGRGEYPYVCAFHPNMHGVLIVQ